MSITLEEEIYDSLSRHGLTGKSALLWVSGGVDSVCLLMAARSLLEKGALSRLEVAHVDHNLRDDSGDDADLVKGHCLAAGIPFHLVALSHEDFPPGMNIQARARELRRQRLEILRVERGLDLSLLAHHADDQAETVLFRFIRGAGPRGLSGISEWAPPYLRPLLGVSKARLLARASEEGWSYREDPTNRTGKYSRNRVRNELLPLAREIAPGADGSILRGAALLRQDEEFLTGLALEKFNELCIAEPEGVRLPVEGLSSLHPALLNRIFLAAAQRVAGGAFSLDSSHLSALADLFLPGGAQRQAPVPGPAAFHRVYGFLWVVDPSRLLPQSSIQPDFQLLESGEASCPGFAPLPDGRPKGQVRLRPRLPGDLLGERKVKDILMEARIPSWRRKLALVAEDDEGALALFAPEAAFGLVKSSARGLGLTRSWWLGNREG